MRWGAFRSGRAVSAVALGAAAFVALTAAAPSATPDQPLLEPATIGEAQPVLARWSVESARQLADIVAGADGEGLDPRDYQLSALRHAIGVGEGAGLDGVADAAALALAHDYFVGRVGDRSTIGWLIERSPYDVAQLPAALQAALQAGALDRFYQGLLPQDARYAALREALASTDDPAMRDRLRANMERARWMPRTAEADYLYVNVPSYRLQVVADGQPVSTYTVVVGAKDTPTPQLISPTSSLVVNPWWNVPQSIVKSSNLRPGKAGFQFTSAGGSAWAVRQPPGPRNALGRIKFNLVNDQAIYLHDTPAKAAFARTARALSHGCVRVKNIDQLAAELMNDDAGRLDEALAGTDTATLRLPRTWPVQIVYFTADVGADGKLVTYDDIYGHDAQVIAALGGSPIQMASR